GTDIPIVVSVGAADPALRNTPIQTVDVVLSEPIDPSTFDGQDLTLTRDGGPNLITPDVTVTQVGPTTYRIGGLAPPTALGGDYVLTVAASGLADLAGQAGIGSLPKRWTVDVDGPTIAALQAVTQSPRNTVVPSLDVTFSEPIDPSTFTVHALA